MAEAGAICDSCNAGRWKIVRTKRIGFSGTRYLKCPSCGATAKQPIEFDPATNRPELFYQLGSSTRTKLEK